MKKSFIALVLILMLFIAGCGSPKSGYSVSDDGRTVGVVLPQNLATGYFWSPTFLNGSVEVKKMTETDERISGYGSGWTAIRYELIALSEGEEEVYFILYSGEEEQTEAEYYYCLKIDANDRLEMSVTHTAAQLPPDSAKLK